MFQDITERKLAEEKIAQTEKRFKSLIERAPDGVVLIGPDLNFTYVSPTAKRIFGYDDDAPIDIPPNDATHPDDLPRVLEALSCLIQDPSLMPTLQYRFRRKNGAWLWIESTFTNLFAEPSVNAIVINFRDVTERVEAERKIQESEERSRLAHSAADLGTWQEDLVEHTFALDERACRHYDQDDEHPSSAVITRCVHPEDLPRLQDVTRSTISAGRDLLRVEYRVVHRDGSIRWLAIHSQVYFEERNGVRTPLMAAGTSQDITERKAADDELARRNRQLRLIYEATQRLNFSLDPAHVHEVIYASVRELMPCDTLFISAFDPASSMISMAGGWHDGRPVDLAGYEPIPLEPQGSGIQSRVIRTKEPELIQDFQARLKNVQVAHHHDGEGHPVDELPEEGDIPRSALAVPLLAEGNVLGVIQVFSYRLDAYTGDDLQILNGFSAQAAIALSNARLYESVQQENLERQRAEASLLARTTQLEALFNISDHLGSAQTEQQALSVVMAELKPLMGAHAGAIALVEPDRQHIKLVRAEHLLAQNLGQRFLVEEGICGKVLRSGQVYLTDSYADDPFRVKEVAGVESLGPAVFAPIRAEDDYIGVLVASREKNSQSRPFDADAVRMMTAIGEIAGSALRRVRLFEQTSAQLSQLRTLQKVDRAITGSLDLDLTLRLLLTEITSHLAVDAAAVLLLHPHSLILECAAAHGFRQRSIEQTHIMIGQCVAGRAALTHETIHITDLQNDANFSRRQMVAEEGFQSYSVAPLITKGKVVGVFEFYSRGVIERGLDWDDFLETLADQATIAIENARLFSDLQRSNLEMELAYDATIEGWARAVDLRGHEAEGHSVRMSELALGLAASMGMREADMIHLRRGALLHDIGNLGIPDEILLKQSELTPEEWEVMRRHPVMAYELLHPIQFLRPALDIPYCHHEKWDGSGYPRGLAGERIPLAARIFSVADEFAALTSDRPYRPAWTRDKAISYIEEQSGLHFDPQVVNAFRLWVRIH
jgi:PAS domain S-box-containing protein